MSRKASRRQPIGISLFPFLAVLICTMGVIIVMLVIVVRQASQRAHEETANVIAAASARDAETTAAAEAEARKLREAVADAEWENDILAKQREAKAEELAKTQQLLEHVDDHLRRLREQAQQLIQQAQDIDSGKKFSDDELDAARKELAKLKEQIAKSEAEVDALKKKVAEKQKWFALIPYDGPNGTRRRPIYIECSEVGITLQPEGVTLNADDFNGPLGRGNPLDAALRAKRQWMEQNGETGMPYPLLIVRPDGVVAYAVARAALKSWDEEFGYELIDAEKKLAFGQGDPKLAQMLENTVRQARQRQAQRAVAMPRNFQAEDNLPSFRTDDVLSSAPEIQMAARGLGTGTRGGSGVGNGTGNGSGTGNAGGGPNRTVGGGTGSGFGGDGLVMGGGGTNSGGGPNSGANGFVLRPGTGSAPGNGSNTSGGTGVTGGTGTGGTGPGGTGAGNSQGPNAAGSSTAGGTNSLRPSGSGNTAAGGTSASGASGGVAGGPNSYGAATGSAGAQNGSPNGGQASATGANSGGSSSSSGDSGQSSSATADASKNSTHPKRRQHNWGLPNAGNHAVAVTRPIRVSAMGDRVVILPDKGDAATSPQNIRIQGDDMTIQELDVIVAAVQKQMQGWGLAVTNGYWKPVLSVDVLPSGERRFQELEVGLKNSGFDVQRKLR